MSTLRVDNVTDLGDDPVVTAGVVAGGALPAGSILQVVSTTKSDTFSASVISPNETAITGLTASITPSLATSKILVIANVALATSDNGVQITLNRDGSEIGIGDVDGSCMRVTNNFYIGTFDASDVGAQNASFNFLDSPATTSSVTYSFTIGNTHAGGATRTVYVNRQETSSTSSTVPRPISTLTVMEVAG